MTATGTLLVNARHTTVCRSDPDTGRPVGEPLASHTGDVRSPAVVRLPDRRTLPAGAAYDNAVLRWDVGTGEPVDERMEGHSPPRSVMALVAVRPEGGHRGSSTGADPSPERP